MTQEDVKDFVLEGEAYITFENQRMRWKNQIPSDGIYGCRIFQLESL